LGQVNYATPYTFQTIAGNAGYGTADGIGSAARFYGPQGAAAESSDVFYVTDSDNSTVRSITPGISAGKTNWTVCTLAGLGGSSGSVDGLGSAARFYHPNGIAVDSAGNLYVADTGNSTIRMMSPSLVGGQTQWLVTTIAGLAGAPGSADGTNGIARFNRPAGLAVDGAGNLYVADNANATIRMIRPSVSGGQTNRVVATIAGLAGMHGSADGPGAAARFYNPFGIAADVAGNLYATDYGSSTIRELTPGVSAGQTNWTVKTIAGSVGGFGSADGTGNAAQFYNPFGIAVDGAGSLYVADAGNETIRKITPTHRPLQPPVGAAGSRRETVRKITPNVASGQIEWVVTTIAGSVGNSGSSDGIGDAALFSYPNGVAVNRGGALCVADTFNNTLREITPGVSGGLAVWVVTTTAGLAGGSGSADGTGTAAQFFNPLGMAVDTAGNLYVADSGNDTIRQVAPGLSAGQTNWAVSTIAGSPENAGSADGTGAGALFSSPMGVGVDSAGNLYVADSGNDTIREAAPGLSAGQTNWGVSTIAGLPGIAGAADGTGGAARFNGPTAIAVAGTGSLYVADAGNSIIRKMTAAVSAGRTQWTAATIAGSAGIAGSSDGSGSAARFNNPGGVAVDGAGNLYVADTSNDTIRKITPSVSAGQTNWVVTTIAGSPGIAGSADGPGSAAQFSSPLGIAADPAGNVYVADFSNGTVRKLRPGVLGGQTQWLVTTIGGLAGNHGAADGTGSAARFASPSGIAVNGAGNLFVADCNNNTVSMGFSPPYIVLDAPTLGNGQVQIGFWLLSGVAASFNLLNASQPNGPWSTNVAAVLTTNPPGASYTFTTPLPQGSGQFYRVQRP
jgi:sugar lactone lactonase YvrE